MHLHILGACGTLMGSIAMLARELGHKVTGTDQNVYPPMSTQLENAGIRLSSPYTAENIPDDADLVVIGNAGLQRGNPAVEAVLRSNRPYTSGAEWLARYLLPSRWVIAVSGTHGKTTTSAMIAWILEHAGLGSGFLVGGVPKNFGVSSRLGKGPFFVIEADEYDTSYFDRRSKFLHYKPRTLVINNLEFDHADIFSNLEEIETQFHHLLRTVPDNGLVIYPGADPNIQRLIDRGCWTPRTNLGGDKASAALLTEDGGHFRVDTGGETAGEVQWSLTGNHNVSNALAAIVAAGHAGVTAAAACKALGSFTGVKRRMEVIYEKNGVTLYDDFAHHPTAIETTLKGLRARVAGDRILAVIEPASHTMKKGIHAKALLASTASADGVYWFQPENIDWNMQDLSTANSFVEADMTRLLTRLSAAIQPPMHLVIMSNGAFGGLHRKLIAELA